jgi:hypothetical protein
MPSVRQALLAFDAKKFVDRHGGYKESLSAHSFEYLLPCPYCSSSRLRWNVQKCTWICWGCRRTGDTFKLIQVFEKCDDEQALAILFDGYVGGNAPAELHAIPAVPARRKQKLTRLPQIPWPSGVDVLADTPLHAPAWEYLRTRGLGPELLRDWRLGWGRLGWLREYIVFPVMMDGGLVYWQGRAAYEQVENAKVAGYRKTLNPRSVPGCATAQDVLFNYDRAKSASHLVICEGPIDALKIGPHAVALFGKVASPSKVARLLRCRALRYTVYLDAGEEERQRAEHLAAQLSGFAPTHIATPPTGYDPGALTKEQNAHVIAQAPRFTGRSLGTL